MDMGKDIFDRCCVRTDDKVCCVGLEDKELSLVWCGFGIDNTDLSMVA